MTDEWLTRAQRQRNDAQDLRRKGRAERSPAERSRLFREAADEFRKAIATLERRLRMVRTKQDGGDDEICRVLEALSQTCGSLGGTFRDAGDLQSAVRQYDRGNVYEEERRVRCHAKDTYNMLQRLVVRLLENPKLLGLPDFVTELNKVRLEVERQFKAGRDDSWGLADLALARFLCGVDAGAPVDALENRVAEGTFYESAHTAIVALIDEGLGKEDALGERLEAFKRLLQRKGGLA